MNVFRSIQDFKNWRSKLPPPVSVGFVPTMGALHPGHASLIRRSLLENDITILSIFVNPTQFGPNEDFNQYPRTLEEDLELARSLRVDAVLLPTVADVYPTHYSTMICESVVSKPLCGIFRPGHFDGVTTIVLKLFLGVRPNHAYFGMKDAQQFYVIQKMVKDLDLELSVVGVDTVREESGLALSSRNRYLSSDARTRVAPMIYTWLCRLREEILSKGAAPSIQLAARDLKEAGFQIQYLEIRSLPRLESFDASIWQKDQDLLIAFAGLLEKTRLIDNVIVQAIH
jgi:pantoate--beta-alanine ligase